MAALFSGKTFIAWNWIMDSKVWGITGKEIIHAVGTAHYRRMPHLAGHALTQLSLLSGVARNSGIARILPAYNHLDTQCATIGRP